MDQLWVQRLFWSWSSHGGEKERLTIGGKGRLLVEMPLSGIPMYAGSVILIYWQMVLPVWAHPERCFEVIDKVVFPYVRNGVLLQINVGSLLGFMVGKLSTPQRK